MSALSRRVARQADIIEWAKQCKADLTGVHRERQKLEKGFVAYGKDIVDFIREMRGSKKVQTSPPTPTSTSRALTQYHQSQELLKRMKWKRATWDEDADYESFSQRLLENDGTFSKCPAFSFLSVHVVKDPLSSVSSHPQQHKPKIDEGDLVQWILTERDDSQVAPFQVQKAARRAPFNIDWVSGEVKILDTASPTEVLAFLSTSASRLQALQIKMDGQQQKLNADIENVRVRVGLSKIRVNSADVSMWDDQERKTNPDYVSPDELAQFLDTMLKSAFLYRLFLKGHQVRVTRSGTPYCIDKEQNELRIPANFDDFSFLMIHKRLETVEKIFNFFRTFWWFWFGLSLVVIGDVELL
jgi:hypothetical protein